MKTMLTVFTLAAAFTTQSFAQNASAQNTAVAGQKQNSSQYKPNNQSTTSSSNVYYANCTDARNKAAAPIYRGEPGYRSALDRDDDGVACEPYKGHQ